jgi:hypothetical protein
LDIFDTNVLVGTVKSLMVTPTFLLDTFFKGTVATDEEYLSVDVDLGLRRMAPFVSPLVEGKLVESRQVQTNTFRPAYVKDKRAPDLKRPVRRMLGERIGGEMSAREREMANLKFELQDQIDNITRRLVWMGAQALLTGTVTVAGDGFETTVVNFNRNSALTLALSGTATWAAANVTGTAPTASPTNDLDTWAAQVLESSGSVPTDVVFSLGAWQLFVNDPNLKNVALINAFGRKPNVDLTGGIGDKPKMKGVQYKGQWGDYDLWLYNDWYIDANGNQQPMLPGNVVIMGSEDIQGTRMYGAIMDPAHNYGALPFAPKSWLKEDPAQRYLMMQSAPLVVPERPNASFCATVA